MPRTPLRLRLVAIVALVLAAGCTTPIAPSSRLSTAHDAAAPAFVVHATGRDGGEPSIGVTKDGAMLVAGNLVASADQAVAEQNTGGKILRSTDDGASWQLVGDIIHDPKQDSDPYLWLDPATDRVFNVPLSYPTCSWLEWTDDKGASWDADPAVACAPPGHDHQKLATAKPTAGVQTLGYPNVVYYAYNSLLVTGISPVGSPVDGPRLGAFVATSIDGGRTFGPAKNVHASDCHRGIVGPPGVAPEGTVYVPHGTCSGLDIMVTRDSGQTWDTKSLNDVGSLDDFAFDPAVAVDDAGVAYAVWPGKDALLYLSQSADHGRAWSAPVRLTPPGVTATVYSSAVAGAPGKLAVAYASTTRDPSGWAHRASSFADPATAWDLRVAIVDHGVVSTRDVTSADDPLQRGCIWMRGGSSDCRNLYDFVTLTQRDGRLYLAYTDGCDKCATASESRASHVMVAISEDAPLR